jgi:PAS domain S-box-containing protein
MFPVPSLISNINDGRVIEVNDSFIQTMGFSREEVIGRTSVETGLISASMKAEFAREFEARGYIPDREIELKKKSGEKCLGLLASNYIDIDGGRYLISTIIDITGIRRSEQERAEAEMMYRHFTGDGKDALTIIEGENVKFASPGTLDIFGVRPEELTQNVHVDMAAPEEKERVRDAIVSHNSNGGPLEYWIVRKDGSRRKIRNHHITINKGDKTVRKYIITRDVTDEHEGV